MTAATKIKRGGAPARKPRAVVKKRRTKPKGPGAIDKALLALHITPELVRKTTTVLILASCAGLAVIAADFIGVPRMANQALADVATRAGFTVKNIEITGLNHMDRDTVYDIALDQHSMAMPQVDLAGVRNQLLGFGWVADAQVSRRMPDTLVINITERVPAAVWQHDGALSLVDAKGVVLEPLTPETMPTDVPLVIGPDANTQATALTALLSHAPRLKPQIAGATWVGNRRWDLRFQTGEVLALPEGEELAASTLSAFADKDVQHPLLGKGYDRIDLRDGEHMFIKLAPKAATPSKPSMSATSADSKAG